MKNTWILLLGSALLCSFPTMSQTITCHDDEGALVINVDADTDAMSFKYSRQGEIVLFGDLIAEIQNDIPSVSIYNNVLADGLRYHSVMASMQRPVWVEEHTESLVTRSGRIVEYIVPAHYENRLTEWFNILLKEVDGGFEFSRLEGGDFGFTTDHPIMPGTPCTIQ